MHYGIVQVVNSNKLGYNGEEAALTMRNINRTALRYLDLNAVLKHLELTCQV